jgi:hypothetical protein
MSKSKCWLKLPCPSSLLTLLIIASQCSLSQQDGHSSSGYASALFAEGSYRLAIKEGYRLACFSASDSVRFEAFRLVGLAQRESGALTKAEGTFRLALRVAVTDEQSCEATVCLASVLLAEDKPGPALALLLPWLHMHDNAANGNDGASLALLAAVQEANWQVALDLAAEPHGALRDSTDRAEITALIASARDASHVSPSTAWWLSTFLPGLGQFYAGGIQQGFHALILNGIDAYIIGLNILKQDYVSAIIFAAFFAERYYSGNRTNAESLAQRANTSKDTFYRYRILSRIAHSRPASP